MARGSSNTKKIRLISGDLVYNEISISKLINNIMMNGEKQKASKIVYEALSNAYKMLNNESITIVKFFNIALNNLAPMKKAVKRVVRGRTLQIPQDINAAQKEHCASKIMVKCTRDLRKKKGITIAEALQNIMISSYNNTGEGVEYKKSMEAAAEVNKAYKI